LNDRKLDIPLLAEHFLTHICTDQGIARKQFDPSAVAALQEIDWTGNIRELRNIVERLVILCDAVITANDVKMFANPRV
jgi:DNA-binding NtrC family response regulator